MAAVAVGAARRLRAPREPARTVDVPPLSPRRQLVRGVCVMVFVLSFSLLVELLVVSNLQQRAAQQRSFDALRGQLAAGTAPIGPTDVDGRQLALGTPVANLEIPSIGLRQVIVEGTTPGTLFGGPGHRRDSPLPGQTGVSVVMGRRAAFGGPFNRLPDLEEGDLIKVTTGQGAFEYRVTGLRSEGDPSPPALAAGEGRLLLATASGRPFMPDGVLRVDADLESTAVGGARPLFTPQSLPVEEDLMAGDGRTLWALALWLQAVVAAVVGAVWAWHRWGRPQAWIVFVPVLLVLGLGAMGEAARLMPNLL